MEEIEKIIAAEFPDHFATTPSTDELTAIRKKLLKALPVDSSVEITTFMNTVTVGVRTRGNEDINRTVMVK